MAKLEQLSTSSGESVLPTLNLFQLETNDYYPALNMSIYSSASGGGGGGGLLIGNGGSNDTGHNISYDLERELGGCYNGQNPIANLITMALYATVCLIGLFGNTLVIYVVLRYSKMQTVTNTYILNLAIADECFLIGIPFLLYTMHSGSWQFGEYMCKAYMVSTSITQFTSSIFLLIMSADRYFAVCHPISSQRYRTPLTAKLVSAFAWLTSAALMMPVMLFANTVGNGQHVSCNIKWPEEHTAQSGTTFILYTLTLGFATPLTFILAFYYAVIRKLHSVGPKQKSKEKKRSHRKVTKLVLTVIAVYILCWLPFWVSQVVLISSTPTTCATPLEIHIFLLVGCLGYSNSAINPLLYAFLSENFKKSFMKAFICAAQKDVNAALNIEPSMFPKWGSRKNRKTDHYISPAKARQRKAMLARQSNGTNTTTSNAANANSLNAALANASGGYTSGLTVTTSIADPISDVSGFEVTEATGAEMPTTIESEDEMIDDDDDEEMIANVGREAVTELSMVHSPSARNRLITHEQQHQQQQQQQQQIAATRNPDMNSMASSPSAAAYAACMIGSREYDERPPVLHTDL